MPKRTNYFQQLIHHIYRQLAPTGATVTESALVTERSSSTQREIDILVEHSVAGHRVRIGIECRDRSSKDDITWVDGVIGKYKDLDIQKVILVSNSGFSSGAIQKALANNIETHALARINELNIRGGIDLLRMTFIQRSDQIQWVNMTTEPQLGDGELDPKLIVYNFNNETLGDLNGFAWMCYEPFVKNYLHSHITQNMNTIFPAEIEFEHEEVFQVPIQIPEPFPYFLNPERCYITKVLLSIDV